MKEEREQLRILLKQPTLAWPTLLLFLSLSCIWIICWFLPSFFTSYLYFLILLLCILIQSICAFLSFTVMHEAAHGSLSTIPIVNEGIGRLSAFILSPFSVFTGFRHLHQLHHKFTNDPRLDPDTWTSHSDAWSLPLACILQMPWYYVYFLANLPGSEAAGVSSVRTDPESQQMSVFGQVTTVASLLSSPVAVETIIQPIIVLGVLGYLAYVWDPLFMLMVYHWVIPGIIAPTLLAFMFDYAPHTETMEDPYHNTALLRSQYMPAIVLKMLLVNQDLHIIHHLYPMVPFYRYTEVYELKKETLHEKKKVLVRTVL